jgi:hypothetical protein
LVAGRNRVPRPATGNTAVRMADVEFVLIKFFSCGLLPAAHTRRGIGRQK